jgi:hypothetical protein
MNFKTIIAWALAVVFLGAALFLFSENKKKETELAQLRQENSELPNLRDALDKAKKESSVSNNGNISDKERAELIRLRNEVGVLKKEKERLTAELATAQRNTQDLAERQAAQQAQIQQAQQLQQFAVETQEQKNERARDVCINNLRQIDGAKQQWALENKQPADAQVTMQELLPFFGNSTAPVCPSGGVYTVNSVDTPPTCSIAGHALPQ